jgi:hypothetical protein
MARPFLPIAPRFWSKVNKDGPIPVHRPELGQCWEWTRGLTHQGYGKFTVRRQTFVAHRVAYALTNGDIPDGMWVLHHCDNPLCSNPKHLYLGTHDDNNADMMRRGRSAKGENAGNTVLTAEKVLRIRALHASGASSRKLAKEFGVVKTSILNIVHGRTWRHLSA